MLISYFWFLVYICTICVLECYCFKEEKGCVILILASLSHHLSSRRVLSRANDYVMRCVMIKDQNSTKGLINHYRYQLLVAVFVLGVVRSDTVSDLLFKLSGAILTYRSFFIHKILDPARTVDSW